MSIESNVFRSALGNFPTGVTIITAVATNKELVGATVNSFSSVSLTPPLVLFSLDKNSHSLDAFRTAGAFAVNILSYSQESLSTRFAKTFGNKWDGVQFDTWATGAPIFPDSIASFDCKTWATVITVSYSATITACEKCDEWQQAFALQ